MRRALLPLWRASLVAGLGLLALAPIGAQAQQPPSGQQPLHAGALPARQANYAWDNDLLRASFSYRDVLGEPSLLKKLSSGLPMVIAMRAYVYPQGQDLPVRARATRLLPRGVRSVGRGLPGAREREGARARPGRRPRWRAAPVHRGARPGRGAARAARRRAAVFPRRGRRREPRVARDGRPDAAVDVAAHFGSMRASAPATRSSGRSSNSSRGTQLATSDKDAHVPDAEHRAAEPVAGRGGRQRRSQGMLPCWRSRRRRGPTTGTASASSRR